MTHKPLLVLVSGAPGSGKTTFAGQLAKHMNLLHIERDRAFDSMLRTYGDQPFNRQQDGIPAFYTFLQSMIAARISAVVDCTLYKNKSEKDLAPLLEQAHVVQVHCRAINDKQRFYEREAAKPGRAEWAADFMKHIEAIYPDVSEPLDLDCPCIEVDTTKDYQPTLDDVANTVLQHYEALGQKEATL